MPHVSKMPIYPKKALNNARLATPLPPHTALRVTMRQPQALRTRFIASRETVASGRRHASVGAQVQKNSTHGFIFFFLSDKREGNRSVACGQLVSLLIL